jgi:hypothetical protein
VFANLVYAPLPKSSLEEEAPRQMTAPTRRAELAFQDIDFSELKPNLASDWHSTPYLQILSLLMVVLIDLSHNFGYSMNVLTAFARFLNESHFANILNGQSVEMRIPTNETIAMKK